MSEPRKLEPHEAYDVLERIVMRSEAERIAALDDAGLTRELAAGGRTLEGERAKGRALIERLKNRETPAVAVPAENQTRTTSGFRSRSGSRWSASTHRGRRPTLVWMLAAALAMMGLVAFVERREIVARFEPQPPHIEPVPSQELTPPGPTPQEAALGMRREATAACAEMNLDLCESNLNEAMALDPAGENTPTVRYLRTFIAFKRQGPPPKDDPFGKGVKPTPPKGQ